VSTGLRIEAGELRELLVDHLALLTPDEFAMAHSTAVRYARPLEEAAAERGRVPLTFVLGQVAESWKLRFTNLDVGEVRSDALRHVSEEYALKHTLMPFSVQEGALHVAMADPRDQRVLHDLAALSQLEVVPYLAPIRSIQRAHLLYRGDLLQLLRRLVREAGAGPAARQTAEPATQLLQRILEYAALTRASDIHIEPYERETLVRVRIDGVLHEVLSEPAATIQPLAARIKALAKMRIDDRRAPQDGRFDGEAGALRLDLRVSSLPTHWGEKIVLRVLAKEYSTIDLEALGLQDAGYRMVLRNVSRPHGLVLITGPTGSGKSTTLYAVLARLGAERLNLVNISTIEDPVEQPLPRVTQVDLNPIAGIDYASGLRALLRQDPDIIMVGEIRDHDTMEIAMRAALIGRLMLSTLHTNDAPTAIPRLLDMGAEPYLVASTLSMVVAQRLARRVCPQCRESVADPQGIETLRRHPEFDTAIAALRAEGIVSGDDAGLAAMRLFRGRGCVLCAQTGYRGRVGVFEVLEIGDAIRSMILDRHDASAIRTAALGTGMRTLFQDGLAKVLLGETTVGEIVRVVGG
jgi:type IV pilus assembly protein PilB